MKKTFALTAALMVLLCGCGKQKTESVNMLSTETITEAVTEAVTEAETAAVLTDITGVYAEATAGRAQINITTNDNVVYFVSISWSDTAATHAEWDFIGKLDENNELHYENCRKQNVTFQEDGTMAEGSPEIVYTDGTGYLKFSETGIEWIDDKEGAGAGTVFNKMDSTFIEQGVVETTEAPTQAPTAAPTQAPTAAPTQAPAPVPVPQTTAKPATTAKPVTSVQIVTSVVAIPVTVPVDTTTSVVPVIPVPVSVAGLYTEQIAHRGTINVTELGDNQYHILVRWSSSAWEYSTWEMTGYLFNDQINYSDCVLTSYAYDENNLPAVNSDGNQTPYVEYVNGSGTLTFHYNGNNVYWDDFMDNVAADTFFVPD